MRESLRDQLLIGGTREARSQAKAPLDLIVWDSIATVKLCEAFLDFRKEYQAFNGIVDRSILRQFANRLNHLIPGDAMWHTTLILLLVLPAHRQRICHINGANEPRAVQVQRRVGSIRVLARRS